MKVSIIVPVYHIPEAHLREGIISLVNQTFHGIEVILVDDGSPDNSGAICDEYAQKDERIRVIHQENAGVSVARNRGIEESHGEYIMFADPDDCMEAECVETLLAEMNDDIDIISCCCMVFDETFEEPDYFWEADCIFEDKTDLYKQLMRSRYGQPGKAYTAIGVPWGKLYRRSAIEGLTFNPRLKRMQDNVFNMYAFHAARVVKYINKPLYRYRYEHISDYSKSYKPGYEVYILALCEERNKAMESLGLIENPELREFFYLELLHFLMGIFMQGLFHHDHPDPYKKKVKKADAVLENPCFQILFTEKVPLSKGDRLKFWMIRKHHYRLIKMWGTFKYYRKR